MKTDEELLEKAKDGTISPAEVTAVASALRAREPSRDPYVLLHILGRAGAVEHEAIVAEYLESESDPMLARIALQVLCSHWNKASAYLSDVERFLKGVSWDVDGYVRLVAISAAGEYLRENLAAPLLRLLVNIFTDVDEAQLVREAAYCAIARAKGKHYNEIPRASRPFDLENDIDPSVLTWAIEMTGGDGSSQ